jgi:anti-sigma regulatory factor (Ser/Thr protein kinase)
VEPTAPTIVRHVLHALDQIANGIKRDLELLITELVANVVRHAGLGPEDSMEVQVKIEPGLGRGSPASPVLRRG